MAVVCGGGLGKRRRSSCTHLVKVFWDFGSTLASDEPEGPLEVGLGLIFLISLQRETKLEATIGDTELAVEVKGPTMRKERESHRRTP